MQTIKLYRYKRADGGITVSPAEPDGAYTPMLRLIADAGKGITDGDIVTTCADILAADINKWQDCSLNNEDEISAEEALNILLGGAT